MKTPKGFKDFIGDEALKREKIIDEIRNLFKLYGFEPAETPIIEFEEFALKENQEDEAVRDIFRLKDRGKRNLALRYEFTFQLKRIAKNQKLPYKRYQIGPCFRDEPIKKGRLRQFIQADVDIVGSTLKDEAELLSLISKVFSKLGIQIEIRFNNRKLLDEIMVDLKIPERKRQQVMREIDKLDKLPKKEVMDNLKKLEAEKVLKTLESENLEKYSFYKEIKQLQEFAGKYGVKIKFTPFLVRGFSYYNKTVFEAWAKELNVSLGGGGSYLVNGIQSTGFSFGVEPISLLAKVNPNRTRVLLISINQDEKAVSLLENLRKNNISSSMITDKTIGKSLEYADSKKIPFVVFIGKEEVEKNSFKIKDMQSGKEEFLDKEELLKKLKQHQEAFL